MSNQPKAPDVGPPPIEPPSLWQALADYRAAVAKLRGIVQCASHWPGDPAGPDTVGTRCDLLDGHDQGGLATQHRHHVKGSAVVVTW